MKEELKMLQEIKDLEKEIETLNSKNHKLQEDLEQSNKDMMKWKFIMSQKIVDLEDQIQRLKDSHNNQRHLLKEDYAKDLIRISKLSKRKEKTIILNIKTEIESDFTTRIHNLKVEYEAKLETSQNNLKELEEKYNILVERESELNLE